MMTLIKDMLDNLERRNNSDKNGEKKSEGAALKDKTPQPNNGRRANVPIHARKSSRKKIVWLGSSIAVSALVVLVAVFITVLSPSHRMMNNTQVAKANKLPAVASTATSKANLANNKASAKAANMKSAKVATAANAEVKKPVLSSKSSSGVHALYLQAVNNLNEGKVKQAVSELKEVLQKDPKFAPAKTMYDSIIARYGVNTQ